MAFAAFFFGLTYGLLQIVTEMAIVRRERLVGLRVGPYLMAKVAVLVPILFAVIVTMLATLGALDRLPNLSAGTYAHLTVSLMALAITALALGLLASAAVTDPAQATLALPMLCFPAVLFAGAVLPVSDMAAAGRAISVFVPARWGYEAVHARPRHRRQCCGVGALRVHRGLPRVPLRGCSAGRADHGSGVTGDDAVLVALHHLHVERAQVVESRADLVSQDL